MINLPHRLAPGICRYASKKKKSDFYLADTGIVIFAAGPGWF